MKSFWSPKYLVALIVFSLTSLSIDAGTRMARVVTVRDSRTIVVQSGREQVAITLAGVDPVDRVRSIDFLRWTLGQSWVMLEASTEQPGAYFVYRSPDGLFTLEHDLAALLDSASTVDQPEQRERGDRFAAPRFANQSNRFTAAHRERHAVDRASDARVRGEGRAQLTYSQQRISRHQQGQE